MAESDTILQLGIEAAREGNREEARNLFSLLTRQEPDNAQGWLWLAGVANSQEEKRAALERVLALDPNNEMARKSLQSMGIEPSSVSSTPPTTPSTVAASAADDLDFDDVLPPSSSSANLSDEERYAAELDSAFDDYDEVEKVGGGPRNTPTTFTEGDADSPSSFSSSSARDRVDARRNNLRYDDDDVAPRRSGMRPITLILIGLIAVILIALLLFSFFGNRGGTANIDPTAAAQGTAAAGIATSEAAGLPTSPTEATSEAGGTGVITPTTEVSGTGELQPTPETPPQDTPQVPPPAGNYPDPATANPAQVGIGTVLDANGISYSFPSATYATSLGATIGAQTAAQGRYVVVLMLIANNTGTPQAVPEDLFVLKDAQGRVFATNTAASQAYVIPGVNADKSLADQLPADGVAYSVALVFDVAPDASNLVLFTRPNQGQGFLVLNSVQ